MEPLYGWEAKWDVITLYMTFLFVFLLLSTMLCIDFSISHLPRYTK